MLFTLKEATKYPSPSIMVSYIVSKCSEKIRFTPCFQEDSVRDSQFRASIARNDSGVPSLKYLLGPISLEADMTWVPNPKRFNFSRPLIDLRLILSELKVRMSRNQYQDFALLLHSLNTMTLAARYRKYKAQCALEHMNSYQEKFTTRFF